MSEVRICPSLPFWLATNSNRVSQSSWERRTIEYTFTRPSSRLSSGSHRWESPSIMFGHRKLEAHLESVERVLRDAPGFVNDTRTLTEKGVAEREFSWGQS
jgi:hypothetical protein